MLVHAETNRHLFTKGTPYGWDVCEVASKTNPNKKYRVDMTFGRCSCPAWINTRPDANGSRKPCKHLKALGFKQLMEIKPEEMDFNDPLVGTPLQQKVAEKEKV